MIRTYLIVFFCCFGSLGHTSSSAYFSPQDNLAERLIQHIDQERSSIQVAIYMFTHLGIAKALVDAKDRGVDVEVVIDPASARRKAVSMLKKAGIRVSVIEIPSASTYKKKRRERALMHDKFCIFSDKKVWTGSFNFTNEAAVSNRENAIVSDEESLIKAFNEQFKVLKQKGAVPIDTFLEKSSRKSR